MWAVYRRREDSIGSNGRLTLFSRLSPWELGLVTAAGVGCSSLVPLVSRQSQSLRVIPLLLVVVTVWSMLIREHKLRELSPLSPLTLASGVYLIMLGIVPLVDLWFRNPAIYHQAWLTASWMAWIGLLLLYSGYVVAVSWFGREQRDEEAPWSPASASRVAALFLGASVVAIFLALGGFQGIPDYLARFAFRHEAIENPVPLLIVVTLATPAVLLLAGNWLRRPTLKRGLWLLFLWLPLALAVSGFQGQRWRDVVILVALFGIYHFGRQRISTPVLISLVSILILLFVYVAQHRNIVGTTREASSIEGTGLYFNYVSKHEVGQFRDFVLTIEGVPSRLDFQGGRTFLAAIPGTPFPTGGYVFSSTFFPDLYAAGTSIPPPFPGELFMNFGFPGIIVGMAIYGFLVGSVESYFRRNRSSTGALLVYCYSAVSVALVLRGDFTTFGGYYLLGLAALLSALWVVERPASWKQPLTSPDARNDEGMRMR